MKQYYYHVEGVTQGPVSLEELLTLYNRNVLTKDVLICVEGAEEWMPLSAAFPWKQPVQKEGLLSEDSLPEQKTLEVSDKPATIIVCYMIALFNVVIGLFVFPALFREDTSDSLKLGVIIGAGLGAIFWCCIAKALSLLDQIAKELAIARMDRNRQSQ